MNRDAWRKIAQTGAWFAGLSPGFSAALLELARPVPLLAGERLFARDDAPDGLYCILRGMIRITAISASGQEALLAMLEPPQWFGEIAVFDGAARTHDAWAAEACDVLHIKQADLRALLAQMPDYWQELGVLLTQKLRMTFASVEELSFLPPTQRVAGRLLLMAGGYGAWNNQTKRIVAVSQEQLGLMLALSRQTVNRSLKELESSACIKRNRAAIEILDIETLQHIRDGGEPRVTSFT